MEENKTSQGCKGCTGSKKMDPNAIHLEESTVAFYKVQNGDDMHFCFDGVELQEDEIVLNAKLGQELLANNDKLVISTKDSILDKIEVKENFSAQECVMEDNNFYTVISID